jgi:YD repeat-containing protein
MLPQNPFDFPAAMLDPHNRTGGAGEDLLSDNYHWALGILGLSGRAGLDLDLALSYNSLATWVRSGNFIDFDYDNGFPTPGFRLAFPVVDGSIYYNSQAGAYYYLLLTSSGQRVELRRTATANVYESVDSSYLQLTDYGSYLVLRSTDGSQFTLNYSLGQYRCTQIKDRNGNFITINYGSWDTLSINNIADTLGRQINFNYDLYGNLSSITQQWHRDLASGGQATETHQWASFSYGTQYIGNNFSGMTVYGPVNQNITVLTAVNLPDGSQYSFDYNNYGQVTKITRKTPGGGALNLSNYVSYDFSASSTDCPRISARHDMAAQWNDNAETITYFGSDTGGARTMTSPPYGSPATSLVYKEYYGTSWQSGLVTLAEWWYGGVKQKWTTTTWQHDGSTNASYPTNPRATDSYIHDTAGNVRHTHIDYTSSFGLPSVILEYQGDTGNVYRITVNNYNLSSNYTSRRIIGLRDNTWVFDGSWNPYSVVSFGYDAAADLQGLPNSANAVQHDYTNYGTGFVSGRGNLSSVMRWDAGDPSNSSKVLTSEIGYNITGSPIFSRRQHTASEWHQSSVSYADSFSDGNNSRNTFAYPTTATDADGFSSTVQYNFDMGVPFRAQGPPPTNSATNQPYSSWAVQKNYYDSAGRSIRVVNEFNNAYRSFYYDYNYVLSWASVNNVSDEALSLQYHDGHGRVFASLVNHPGSAGGYSGQWTIYDVVGRISSQSTPTEINAGWAAVGDDATSDGSFPRWTQQTYDWKSRPLRTTNTDGTYKEASYSGCGCAGGEVVTLTDEVGRRQMIYSDVLGRTAKAEIYNWTGSTPYSTTTNTYNALDQIMVVRQTDNATGAYQDTTMTYDGYGRLWKKHAPEQQVDTNNSASTDHTTWNYNLDDTIQKVTDARGVIANITYNNRHMVTVVTYDRSNVPTSANVAAAPNLSLGYDAAENRTSMNDGTGWCNYSYDQLSRMTSETHHFNDLNTSSTGGNYALSYQYNLANQLTSIADPFSTQVGYTHDQAGRLSGVTNSGATNFSAQYLSNIQYRAWGAAKNVDYGNGVHQHVDYNARLQPSASSVSNVAKPWPYVPSATLNWTYDYYADGRVHHAYDADDNRFDRSYSYDHAARINEADTNRRARGQSPDYYNPDPYQQSFGFDVWSNSTSRTGSLYNRMLSDAGTYTNNRRSGWSYDAGGAVTRDSSYNHTFNAAGQDTSAIAIRTVGDGSTQWPNQSELEITQSYDGNGQSLKRNQITRMNDYDQETGQYYGVQVDNQTTYYLRSSMLGGAIIDELAKDWQNNVFKMEGYVYAGGQRIAKQSGQYEHHNPVTGSWVTTWASNRYMNREERDPVGGQLPLTAPPSNSTYASLNFGGALFFIGGDPSDLSGGCVLDNLPTNCGFIRNDAAELKSISGVMKGIVNNQIPVWVPDDSKDWWEPGLPDPTNPDQLAQGSYHIGNGGHFEWIPGAPITNFLTLRPQLSPRALVRAEVSSLVDDILKLFQDHPGCEEWTNKLLAEMAKSSGFSAGTIRDILESFRQNGTVYTDGRVIGTGGGSTGTGRGGKPSVSLIYAVTSEHTALTLMHEILHWAGIPAKAGGGYGDYYTDDDMATAWNKLGVVISADEYRRRYPDFAQKTRKAAGYDYTESKLAGAANGITCLDERPAVRTLK